MSAPELRTVQIPCNGIMGGSCSTANCPSEAFLRQLPNNGYLSDAQKIAQSSGLDTDGSPMKLGSGDDSDWQQDFLCPKASGEEDIPPGVTVFQAAP